MSTLTVILALTRLTFDRRLEARGDAVAGIAIDLAGIGLGVLGPYLLKLLVDRLSTGPIDPWSLAPLVAAFVLAWSGTAPLSAARYIFTTRQLGALSRHLIERATAQRLPQIARRRDADSGEMLGALERLPFSLQIVVDGLISRAASLIIQVVASLVVVATLVPPLYVALLATVLLGYFLASRLTAKRFQAQAQATNRSAASVSQLLGDILRNARRVVFNGNLDGEVERVAVLGRARQTEASRLALLLFGTALGQYVVVGAGLVAILVLGGMDVGRGRLTVGDFVLLQAYAFRLALPLGGLGFIIRQAGVAIENIAEVLDLAMARDPAVENRTTAISPAPRAAAIRLDGLFYAYGDTPVLTDANAAIAPGSFVVIAGPNGAGKSTLARLMAGLLDPSRGRVLIDGADMAAEPIDERHRRVLYVPQFVGLFNRSLRENALYPPTRQSEAELAALLAGWGFYESGRAVDFDQAVGEQGERLSGGQIQKLELARLLGVSVPAVILDETTSSLDAPSEKRAIKALRESHCGRTTLILITHRPGLLDDADQILFLRRGRLTAGGHAHLLAATSDYRTFWSEARREAKTS
ncbi:Multidrug resistance ABC transporter ATP-binding/permease protein BmrA [Brevundimonas diminuta]|jgi:ATP-binding cassette subfamily B protein|uniref:ABC transporter ATP-binding protein n=1 Tax=Brevundimonas diminuta TaxID=293 RepID=A0A246K985_BREDI|nr:MULTISPECIES: ABC transporter ATP-binding protein [Brevundimonas]EKY24378.1 ABC transporter, ATP-binding protein [Brevundimonas diminuta 470-4]EGF94753.1 ABC transporter family protein [Brevundimonas diminuta ATCC 11568]MBD3572705.1 ABC transporter ATP-binding protein [Brevundimonas diminuta]MBD3817474.1 ABC transporter ATP-binding protein [Brevundimonas diminuta]MBI2250350.1 ABC transporter ATP-binding protein [Brevundimonas diminuta]